MTVNSSQPTARNKSKPGESASDAKTHPVATDLEMTAAIGFVEALVSDEPIDDAALPALLRRMVAWMRPDAGRYESAQTRVDALSRALRERPDVALAIGTAVHAWLSTARLYRAFVSLGLFSRRGFAREIVGRLYERVNPAPIDTADLRDLLAVVFNDPHDGEWVMLVPPMRWTALFEALSGPLDADTRDRTARHLVEESVNAVEMLATWIAAEEIDEDLMRIDPRLADTDSAFIALNREVAAFVSSTRELSLAAEPSTTPSPALPDVSQVFVILRQCEKQVTRLRKRAVTHGSTVATLHLLERLSQTIRRVDIFLKALTANQAAACTAEGSQLFARFVLASGEQWRLRPLWRKTIRQLALSISDKESGHGEHYITRDQAGLRFMWKSAAGGGVIIAMLAFLKLQLNYLTLTPFQHALLASLNYGLGFVIVYVLNFTIATKQPAMTASRLAEDIGSGDTGRANQERLANTFVDLMRSQLAAVGGNVAVAMALAMAIGTVVAWLAGAPLLDDQNVAYQMRRLDAVRTGALLYAAIAGVWLFVSAIIAGAFDNRAAYLNLRGRIAAHPLLQRLVRSSARRERISEYVHDHYGAIVGNFMFGVMLGMTPLLGHMIGLPLDIRHVAFSSADLGYAAASGTVGWQSFLLHFFFVLAIGGINLLVSFWLALWMALRARAVQLGSLSALFGRFARTIRKRPRLLFVAPRER